MNKTKKANRFKEDMKQLEALRNERECLTMNLRTLAADDPLYKTTNERIREITETISIMEGTINKNKESKASRAEKVANIVKYGSIVVLTVIGLKNAVTLDNNWDSHEQKQTNSFAKSLFSNIFRS